MPAPYPPTYLSRVLPLPAGVAADALDRIRRAGALCAATAAAPTPPSEWLAIRVPTGTLQLARHDPPDQPARILPVRRVPGRLRSRLPGPAVAVELEISPWSAGRTEVGLRYQATSRGRGLRLYHTIGGDGLVQLCDALGARRSRADVPHRTHLVA